MMLNPDAWAKGSTLIYFTQFADAIKNQIIARKTKNWIEDQLQFKNAYQIFVTGIPNTIISFAHFLANGVMPRWPVVPMG